MNKTTLLLSSRFGTVSGDKREDGGKSGQDNLDDANACRHSVFALCDGFHFLIPGSHRGFRHIGKTTEEDPRIASLKMLPAWVVASVKCYL